MTAAGRSCGPKRRASGSSREGNPEVGRNSRRPGRSAGRALIFQSLSGSGWVPAGPVSEYVLRKLKWREDKSKRRRDSAKLAIKRKEEYIY